MSTDENTPVSANDAGDHLEEIEGIGAGYARALNKIGIFRFADFLQYESPEQLQQALEAAGEKIPLSRIKKSDWLGQAKAKVLAQEAQTDRFSQEEKKMAEELQQSARKEKWEQYAGFNLYFEFMTDEHGEQEWRTVVFKSLDPDSFNGREEFLGIEPASWVNWILEQAMLPVTAEPIPAETETAAPPALATVNAAGVGIRNVHVTEIPPSSGFPEKRLKAEVYFQISGAKAEALTAGRTPFRVEVHTVDLESGTSNLVTSGRGQLQPQVFEYTSQQEIPIPELGRYELYSLVLLLPPAEMMASHRGPTIKIVP